MSTHPSLHFSLALGLIASALLALAACGGGGEADTGADDGGGDSAPAEQVSMQAEMKAEQIYKSRCVTCHGEQGKGDGPGAAGLDPKPASFALSTWQESVSDEHIEKIIVYGGAAVGKSPTMPGNPDLKSQPEVVTALRLHIRKLEQ